MAANGSLSPHFISNQSGFLRKPALGMVVLKRSKLSVRKASILQIRSSIKHQVFEDHSQGIVCYKDENGEIICEGLDEGPRFLPQSLSTLPSLRDTTIPDLDLLQKRWLQIFDQGASKDSALLEKHRCECDGSNTLH